MHYLDKAMSKGFLAILVSRLLLFVVGGLLGIFTPIFIYQLLGDNLPLTLAYFGVASLIFWVIMPYGARLVDSIGFKSALIISAFIGALYHYMFYVSDVGGVSIPVFIVSTLLLLTVYRTTYWVPFHTEFAKFSDHQNRGRQVSLFIAASMLIGIFLPTVSAILIENFGFDFVFIIGVGVMILSAVPYFYMPKLSETYSWSVRQTWKEFSCRAKSRVAIAFMAEGAENMIALYLWPIFLYQFFEGDLFDIGAVSTLIIAVSVVLQLVVGRTIDRLNKADTSLKWGSMLYALGWIIKIFVATAFQVFVVGVYHTISKIFTETPVQSMFYDMTSANDEYVDEYTVLREMFVNAGRFGGAVIAIGLSFFVSVPWLFLIGAAAALTFHFVSDRDFDLKRCI